MLLMNVPDTKLLCRGKGDLQIFFVFVNVSQPEHMGVVYQLHYGYFPFDLQQKNVLRDIDLPSGIQIDILCVIRQENWSCGYGSAWPCLV